MGETLKQADWMGDELSREIIGCAYRVSNGLGSGFLEKVYENALAHELRKTGIQIQQQVPMRVVYDGVVVGDYVADLIVEQRVLVELKSARALDVIHTAQCLNYLRASNLKVCLLMNFGNSKLEIRRLMH